MLIYDSSVGETELFRNRVEAGQKLAGLLWRHQNENCIVYGLPRGGAIVAAEVARALHAPLDLLLARKVSHPDMREYAIGAVSEDGEVVLNGREVEKIPESYLNAEIGSRREEANDQREKYLSEFLPLSAAGKVAIVVDDGIATGYTVMAAISMLKKRNPAKIIVATPVGSPDVSERLADYADEVVVPHQPADFFAIGNYYEDFSPPSDSTIIELLRETREPLGEP
ncbi:MAG: putative phosphoribosyl transferase [Fimbriimonadaceae bacterium]|nr:putative phosphoribosyl transferase [Fimbriimonadaceae bacterium]